MFAKVGYTVIANRCEKICEILESNAKKKNGRGKKGMMMMVTMMMLKEKRKKR